LALLLDFDAEAFFQVLLLLFSAKPWRLIANCSAKDYLFEFQKSDSKAGATSGLDADQPSGNRILGFFKQAAERTNRKDPTAAKNSFLDLVLSIVVIQDKEQQEMRKEREKGLA
jgi:hypothetical protein